MPACFSFFSGVKNYSTGTPEINKINPPVVWGPVVRNPFLKWAPVSPGKKTAVLEWLLPTREHESTFQPLYLTPVPPPGCSESLGKWLSFRLENNSTYCLPVFQHCKDSGYHLVDLAQRLAHWCALVTGALSRATPLECAFFEPWHRLDRGDRPIFPLSVTEFFFGLPTLCFPRPHWVIKNVKMRFLTCFCKICDSIQSLVQELLGAARACLRWAVNLPLHSHIKHLISFF